MQIISKEELLGMKNSDTIVILGCGYSINRITDEQWKQIEEFDSVAFNWFCKHDFEPSFFTIREQANTKERRSKTETPKILYERVNRYKNTGLVVLDISKSAPTSLNYAKKLSHFTGKGVVVRDRKTTRVQRMSKDMFEYGLCHGKCTMTTVLHFVVQMGYKKIVFAGVDLNDSRYFWLKKNEARHTIVKKGRKANQKHPIIKTTFKLLGKFDRCYHIPMETLNHKSALVKIMPKTNW